MPRHKYITEYSDQELQRAIDNAVSEFREHGIDFYTVWRGIDAYMEKRRRKPLRLLRSTKVIRSRR